MHLFASISLKRKMCYWLEISLLSCECGGIENGFEVFDQLPVL